MEKKWIFQKNNINKYHHWSYRITIENDFKDTLGHIEYYWYTPVVTRFEAYLVNGQSNKQSGSIRIYHNEILIANVKSNQEAVGILKKYIDKAPDLCYKEFNENSDMLFGAIIK